MKEVVESVAAAYIAPKLMRNFKVSWLAYGALAYLALRFMKNKGILPKQTEAALDVIDRGVETAKSKMGLQPEAEAPLHH